MRPKSDYPVEKKVAIFRRILWFCFGVISLPSLGFCSIIWIYLIKDSFSAELIFPTVFLIIAISILGAICLGIFHIIKNHLEKDEGPFL